MMSRIATYILSLVMMISVFVMSSCEDDFGNEFQPIPEGETEVSFKLGFPQYEGTDVSSRADGNAIDKIETVWIVAFNPEGDFFGAYKIENFTQSEKDQDNNVPEKVPSAHVEFKRTFPNGRYRMFAVVNVDLAAYSEEHYNRIEKLRQLPLIWVDGENGDEADQSNVSKNSQMFGFFVNGTAETKRDANQEGIIEIGPNRSTLMHAWVKRAASKVTIAFDTNDLRENIFIYLKSVSIIDIPRLCYLADPNKPGTDEYNEALQEYNDTFRATLGTFASNQTILFTGAELEHTGIVDYKKWPMISRGDSIFGLYSDDEKNGRAHNMSNEDRIKREHQRSARALFFYENIQPDGEMGTESEKSQVVQGDPDPSLPSFPNGNHPDNDAWKDARPHGTYIEVQAYYENINSDHPSKGDITYRFMLGKDTKINYSAERNHHYMLTMKFVGNANDIDFHIDYEEEAKPGMYAPDVMMPYYYNEESYAIVRATPVAGYELTKVESYIMDNEWRPITLGGGDDVSDLYNTKTWDMQVSYSGSYAKNSNYPKDFPDRPVTKDTDLAANNCEFGYLSLYKVTRTTVQTGGGSGNVAAGVEGCRRAYYNFNNESISLGKRIFDKGIPTQDGTITTKNDKLGTYSITRSRYKRDINGAAEAVDYICKFPLFTRAKTIGTWEVYSGANPYFTNSRYARIRYIAHYKRSNGTETYTDTTDCNVYQTRRLDNPRAIYRSHDSTEPFFVTLMRQDNRDNQNPTFSPVESRGPWTAEILVDPTGLVRLSANGQVATGQGGVITGKTNSFIEFTYTPQGTTTENNSRCAIIMVTYHNNTCSHPIIVRQGYAPIQLVDGGPTWSTFNVHDCYNLAKSPLSIGCLARRYSGLGYPIQEITEGNFGYGKAPGLDAKFPIYDPNTHTWKREKGWRDIPTFVNDQGKQDAFTDLELTDRYGNKNPYRLLLCDELPTMGISITGYDIDTQINYGFGIVYADGAKSTLATPDAVKFTDPDNTGAPSEKGAIGVVAYNIDTGANLFFPFGITGHGRRKSRQFLSLSPSNVIQAYGINRYGSIDVKLDQRDFDNYRPLAWNLPEQMGATYWINNDNGNQTAKTSPTSSGNCPVTMDFNSGNYMVAFLGSGDMIQGELQADGKESNKYDAAPIKPVLK